MSKSPITPSVEALYAAADWLDINEGDEGEAENCQAVAEWLRVKADQIISREVNNEAIRDIAQKNGITPREVRSMVAKSRSKDQG